MRKWTKVLTMMLTAVLLMAALSACGKKDIDAAAAVDAYLKAETKGEFDEYAKLTGEDKEDLQEEYEQMLADLTSIFSEVESLGVDFGDGMTEEVKNLLASVKYEVKEATKDDAGNYVVDVDVYPSDAMVVFYEKVMEVAQNASDVSQLGDQMVQAFKDAIAEQTYGEPVTCQVHIDYNEDDKQYEINESDIEALAGNFFSTDMDMEDMMSQMYEPTGTVYDNPYLNWTYDDWSAASDEEKTQCCLAITQAVQGFTDEEMAAIDVSDPTVQEGIQTMKDGIELSFSSGMEISMGDYVEIIKEQM